MKYIQCALRKRLEGMPPSKQTALLHLHVQFHKVSVFAGRVAGVPTCIASMASISTPHAGYILKSSGLAVARSKCLWQLLPICCHVCGEG